MSTHEKPRIVDAATLFEGRVFSVVREQIRLPEGAQIEREVVEHPGAAAVLPFLDPQTVLLVRQYRPAANDDLLEVPAGVLDSAEAPETCMQRELAEETGYRAGHLEHVLNCYPTPGFVRERLSLYVAWDLHTVNEGAHTDDDEHITLERVPFDELRTKVARGEIQDGKTVTLVSHITAFALPSLEQWRSGGTR